MVLTSTEIGRPEAELWYPCEMRWNGSKKRRALKLHLLLVLCVLE